MPPQDAAWLGMERPTNLMVVTAVLMLDGRPDLDDLRAVVQRRVVDRYPGFRRRVVRTWRRWPRTRWQDDPDFDLGRHLSAESLDGALSTSLDGFIAGLLSQPLDRSRPLWLMRLVTGSDGDSALVVRVHHCMGDGIALAQVLLSLTDPLGGDPLRGDPPGASTVTAPRLGAWAAFSTAARVLTELVRVPLLPSEPASGLRGPLSRTKVVARGTGVDLAEVKRRADGASVNEAVLLAVTAALREHLLATSARVPAAVRVLVPVDLRGRGAAVPSSLGNRFGMVLVTLPVGEPDADRRRDALRRDSSRARASAQALATLVGLTMLGALPVATQALAVSLLGRRATAVVTNVPGPRETVALAGSAVRQVTFWVPQTGAVGVGISVFSYAGAISVGVAADARLLPDPAPLVSAIEAGLSGIDSSPDRDAGR